MKKLYLIGGTMGVGKTTTCQVLKRKLDRSVFIDGDWCWDMHPFMVNEETKKLVLENICMLLNNDLKCSVFDHIIFCYHVACWTDTGNCTSGELYRTGAWRNPAYDQAGRCGRTAG